MIAGDDAVSAARRSRHLREILQDTLVKASVDEGHRVVRRPGEGAIRSFFIQNSSFLIQNPSF